MVSPPPPCLSVVSCLVPSFIVVVLALCPLVARLPLCACLLSRFLSTSCTRRYRLLASRRAVGTCVHRVTPMGTRRKMFEATTRRRPFTPWWQLGRLAGVEDGRFLTRLGDPVLIFWQAVPFAAAKKISTATTGANIEVLSVFHSVTQAHSAELQRSTPLACGGLCCFCSVGDFVCGFSSAKLC